MNVTAAFKSYLLWCYDVVPETLYLPELGEYHTNGVLITTPEHTEILHDVSVCRNTAEHIVRLLNHHQVSPIHLRDVVMDLLF